MILRSGNLWEAPREMGATLIGVTTNAYVGRHGLVMGRGAALEARQRWPWLPGRAGQALATHWTGMAPDYGWRVVPDPRIGLFQVKRHWRDAADLRLIAASCAALAAWLDAHPAELVALNFPGIGNGRLRRADVLPVIQQLPDRVIVYEYRREVGHAPA